MSKSGYITEECVQLGGHLQSAVPKRERIRSSYLLHFFTRLNVLPLVLTSSIGSLFSSAIFFLIVLL